MKISSTLILPVLIALLFSCGDSASLLPDPGNSEEIEKEQEVEEDVPKGIHWREEIGTFKISPDRAVNWDYSEEGVISIPSDEIAIRTGEDLTELKAGDVIVVWGQYIVFVKEVVNTDQGMEITVRPFVLGEAIYGEFDLSFFEENQGIGNLGAEDATFNFSKSVFGEKASVTGGVTDLEVSGHLKFTKESTSAFKGRIPKGVWDGIVGGRPRIDHLRAGVTFGLDIALAPTVHLASVGLSKKWEPEHRDDPWVKALNKKIPSIKLGTTGLAIKPDFYVPRSISVNFESKGTVGFDFKASASLPLGFEYYRKGFKRDDYMWATQSEFNFFPNDDEPARFDGSSEWTGSLEAPKGTIKADVGLGLDFKIVPAFTHDLGVRGLGFETKINAGVEIDPLNVKRECFVRELYVNVSAKADVELFFEGWGPDWKWRFLPENSDATKQLIRKEIIPKKVTSNFCIEDASPRGAKLTLTWTEATDLDIHMLTSNGIEISPDSGDSTNADDAKILKDDCYKESICIEGEVHTEVIEWSKLKDGTYEVWAENFNGKRSANYKLEMTYPSGEKVSRSGQISGVKGAKTEVFKFTHTN